MCQLVVVSCENGLCLVLCSLLVSALQGKISNQPKPNVYSAACQRVILLPPSPDWSASFAGRTDPIPIVVKYDVMGMGRMEMEVIEPSSIYFVLGKAEHVGTHMPGY